MRAREAALGVDLGPERGASAARSGAVRAPPAKRASESLCEHCFELRDAGERGAFRGALRRHRRVPIAHDFDR